MYTWRNFYLSCKKIWNPRDWSMYYNQSISSLKSILWNNIFSPHLWSAKLYKIEVLLAVFMGCILIIIFSYTHIVLSFIKKKITVTYVCWKQLFDLLSVLYLQKLIKIRNTFSKFKIVKFTFIIYRFSCMKLDLFWCKGFSTGVDI